MRPNEPLRKAASASAFAIAIAIAISVFGFATPASALGVITYTGGSGDTVYGVAPYCCGAQGVPKFIPNNVTGFNDILASPGGAFQLANPVIANNISQFATAALPLTTFQIGGGNGFGPFGSGATQIAGPDIAFRLSDAFPAGGTASYSISSWESDFVVAPGGFVGNLGTFLAIGGSVPAFGSAAAASLVTDYYLNGILQGTSPALILAASGAGNTVAFGGGGAFMQLGNNGFFRGLAVDNVFANLAAGTNLKVVSTLTAYADPASIDTIDITPDLLSLLDGSMPDFAIAGASGTQVPEPATWALLLLGFFGVGRAFRRRRRLEASPA
jgi:hypothetical protein